MSEEKKVIDNIFEIKKEEIKKNKKKNLVLKILYYNEEESLVYVNNKIKVGTDLGIVVEKEKLSSEETTQSLKEKLDILNNDKNIDGIIVQTPLPPNVDKSIFNYVNKNKDVDCLNEENLGKLIKNVCEIMPCTAKGVIDIINYFTPTISGLTVCMIGRSELVGKPLINYFVNQQATVISCNSKTKNIKELIKNSDIIVIAIGQKEFFDETYFSENQLIIDVGINVEDNKLYGDVKKNLKIKNSFITPVPGGVGRLTVINIFDNLIKLAQKEEE